MSKTLFERGRYWFLWTSLLAMLTGLICSRAALSIGEVLFVVTAFSTPALIKKLREFYSDFSNWIIQLLFLLPFISFAWSDDTTEWTRIMEIKAPLFFLPAAFFIVKDEFSKKQLYQMAILIISFCLLGSLWSFWQYLQAPSVYDQLYLKAKIFPTPMDDEHLRFSQLCAVCILLLLILWDVFRSNWQRCLMVIAVIWLVIYLHLLASRMGLIGLYIILIIYIVSVVSSRRKLLPFALLLTVLSIAAYFIFPTLKNRVSYVKWDFEQYTSGNYVPGLNDAPRIVSYRAGWQLFQQAPIAGLGAGDVKNELMKWYDQHAAGMPAYQRLFPTSEWLMYAVSNGVIGVLVLSVVIFLPLFRSIRSKQKEIAVLHLIMIVSFLFEINLTVQYGIFMYIFFVFLVNQLKRTEDIF